MRRPNSLPPATPFTLCTTCGGLKSPDCTPRRSEDHCRCEPAPPNQTVQESEHRLPCRLCHVCGLEVAPGHTRWRLVVCETCKPRVRALNQAAGRVVIPPGIHSIVNQTSYQPRPNDDPSRLVAFADQLKASLASVSEFDAWATDQLLHRLRALGLASGLEIPLQEYLDACTAAGIDHDDGWHGLEAHILEESMKDVDELFA